MCKICSRCKNIMNYDPYFGADVCTKCGKIDRDDKKNSKMIIGQQKQKIEITKRIYGVMMVR